MYVDPLKHELSLFGLLCNTVQTYPSVPQGDLWLALLVFHSVYGVWGVQGGRQWEVLPQLPQGLSDPHLRARGLTRCLLPSPDWMKQETESVWNKTSPPRAHLKWARDSSPATICQRNVVWATAWDRQPDVSWPQLGWGFPFWSRQRFMTQHWVHTGPMLHSSPV